MAELTLEGLVRNAASAYPVKDAFIDGDVHLTFSEFDRLVDVFAAVLRDRGVGPGDRVAGLLFNQWEFSLTYFATLRLGAVIVPLNHRLVASELAFQVKDAGVRVLVFAGEFAAVAHNLHQRGSADVWIVVPSAAGDHWDRDVEWGSFAPESLPELLDAYAGASPSVGSPVAAGDASAIWYTSGTTGRPKGAIVTHASTLWAASSLALTTRMNHHSRLLAVAPMFHRGPTDTMHIACFMLGATQTMLRSFSPTGLLKAIEDNRSTHAFIVPAMTFGVLGLPGRGDYDLTSMECWMSASAPLPVEYQGRMQEETTLPAGRFYNAYGITEALLIGTLLPEQMDRAPSVGRAVPMCRVQILDGERRALGPGEVGEIVVATPAMASGYVGHPEDWAAVTFERDGLAWYASGDLGYVDAEGYLYIVDRAKDMVISGGENVYSAEVEEVLVGAPGVAEVAVIGTPSEQWGEAVTAVIVLEEGADASVARVEEYCSGRLAGYKRPKVIRFVEALPRNSFGKVRKDQLRRDALGWRL
ncbi:long-chain fatty acid--CoA ligase [Nocardioides endophyticus]|uniref:Long-chain fatty acid--CoA ligase n=1 Tax=Nocardioides endophyticus TaxID=1353775 RepID=A0ABP8ZCW4_9ACTN